MDSGWMGGFHRFAPIRLVGAGFRWHLPEAALDFANPNLIRAQELCVWKAGVVVGLSVPPDAADESAQRGPVTPVRYSACLVRVMVRVSARVVPR